MPNKSSFSSHEAYLKWYRDYRSKRAEHFRDYNREYNKQWRKKNGYRNELRYREKYPEKHQARLTLQRAVRNGVIKKMGCVMCGDINSQGHHEDYTKPLKVIWLCPLHHKDKHRKNYED